jgi:adenosylmethionine-8-amino-7-oxononanoate aminotransferase
MTRADDTLRWRELDRRHHLHPFTDPAELASGSRPRIITRAEGCWRADQWPRDCSRHP